MRIIPIFLPDVCMAENNRGGTKEVKLKHGMSAVDNIVNEEFTETDKLERVIPIKLDNGDTLIPILAKSEVRYNKYLI